MALVQPQGKNQRETVFANKVVPLYYQLDTILREKILSRGFEPGVPLPAEDALAEEYGVSRITVRQALSSLARDGFIIRKRGKGTFVSDESLHLEPAKLTGSIEDLISMGLRTSTKIIDFSLTQVAKKITDNLGLPEGTKVVRIERIRIARGSSFSYILNYLPPAVGQKIQADDLLSKPLLRILEDDLGIALAEASQTIEASIADSYVASLLEIRVGDPLLKVERTVLDSRHRPVEFVSVVYRADKYCYSVKLERGKAEMAPHWRHI